jgi:hypothetical protein
MSAKIIIQHFSCQKYAAHKEEKTILRRYSSSQVAFHFDNFSFMFRASSRSYYYMYILADRAHGFLYC